MSHGFAWYEHVSTFFLNMIRNIKMWQAGLWSWQCQRWNHLKRSQASLRIFVTIGYKYLCLHSELMYTTKLPVVTFFFFFLNYAEIGANCCVYRRKYSATGGMMLCIRYARFTQHGEITSVVLLGLITGRLWQSLTIKIIKKKIAKKKTLGTHWVFWNSCRTICVMRDEQKQLLVNWFGGVGRKCWVA